MLSMSFNISERSIINSKPAQVNNTTSKDGNLSDTASNRLNTGTNVAPCNNRTATHPTKSADKDVK